GWYVRLIRGNPVKAANGIYVFQQSGIEVHCMDSAGNMYVASTGICPLDNFRRMVDYSRPTVEDGNCAMTTTQYSNMGCPRTIADNEPVPLLCEVYRRVCTNKACPPAHILSAADYQCYPTAETQGPSSSTNSSSGSSSSSTNSSSTNSSSGSSSSSTNSSGSSSSSTNSSSTNSSSGSSSSGITTPPGTSAFLRPMNLRPRVLSPEKRRRIAADILHGATNGVAVGAALQEYNRQG
ncbi:hypothetical protein IOCL1545_000858400, partial [Leishmania shawi]